VFAYVFIVHSGELEMLFLHIDPFALGSTPELIYDFCILASHHIVNVCVIQIKLNIRLKIAV